MNTSATGGFLQPEPGLARSDIERLIGDVIAGITGLPRDLVRERIAVPQADPCLLYTSPSPRDVEESRMPSSA